MRRRRAWRRRGRGRRLAPLLKELFSVNEAQPIDSPTPGGLTVLLPQNCYIQDGRLIQKDVASATWNSIYENVARDRQAGLAIFARIENLDGFDVKSQCAVGFDRDAARWSSIDCGIFWNGTFYGYDQRAAVGALQQSPSQIHDLAVILRESGAFLVERNENGLWCLVFVVENDANDPLYPTITIDDETSMAVSRVVVTDLSKVENDTKRAGFGTPQAMMLARTRFRGANGTAVEDHQVELGGEWEVIAGGGELQSSKLVATGADLTAITRTRAADAFLIARTGTTAQGLQLIFRFVDANNYWSCWRTATNLELWENDGGAWTSRGSAAVAIADDETYFVRTEGTGMWLFHKAAGGTYTTGPSYTSSLHATASKHGLAVPLAGGLEFNEFVCYPLNVTSFMPELPPDGADKREYLLRDEFVTNEDPITSPRTCEPGPGSVAVQTPADGLVVNGEYGHDAASNGWNCIASEDSVTPFPGLFMEVADDYDVATYPNNSTGVGASSVSAPGTGGLEAFCYVTGGGVRFFATTGAGFNNFLVHLTTLPGRSGFVYLSEAAFAIMRDEGSGWRLSFVIEGVTATTVWPQVLAYVSTGENAMAERHFRVSDLRNPRNDSAAGTDWTDRHSLAVLRDTFTGDVDDIEDHTPEIGGSWTVQYQTAGIESGELVSKTASFAAIATVDPGTPNYIAAMTYGTGAGSIAALCYRFTDINNMWIALNVAGTFQLYEYDGGAATLRGSAVQAVADGDQLIIRCDGAYHSAHHLDTTGQYARLWDYTSVLHLTETLTGPQAGETDNHVAEFVVYPIDINDSIPRGI